MKLQPTKNPLAQPRRSLVPGGAAVFCLVFFLACSLQSPPGPGSVSESKVERKYLAPVSKEVLRVKLPAPVEATLANGLTVLILEDRRLPTVSMRLHLGGAGALYDPARLPGLAGVTAQMLLEGTRSRASRQIAEEVERLGAHLSASAGFGGDAAAINASGLSDNFDEWFALARDVLLQPVFPAEELGRLKQRLKTQLRQQRASSSFLSGERFSRAVFGSHPAAVVSSTPEAIDALTPAQLAQWHRDRYAPQNAILGIAGDVRAAELIPKLNRWLAGWQRSGAKESPPPPPAPAKTRKVYVVDRPNSIQTTLAMGNIAIDRGHPDYIPMTIMNRILGGGSAARLFLNLREEKGYTYGVYSSFAALRYPGPWRAGGDVRTEVTGGAMKEFFYELRRIGEEKVSGRELEDAKRSVVAGFALSLERPAQVLEFAITRKIHGLPANYWDGYPEKVMAVTVEEVQRVARKYLDLETVQIVAVGNAAKVLAELEKYGPVELYDTEGRAIEAAPSPS